MYSRDDPPKRSAQQIYDCPPPGEGYGPIPRVKQPRQYHPGAFYVPKEKLWLPLFNSGATGKIGNLIMGTLGKGKVWGVALLGFVAARSLLYPKTDLDRTVRQGSAVWGQDAIPNPVPVPGILRPDHRYIRTDRNGPAVLWTSMPTHSPIMCYIRPKPWPAEKAMTELWGRKYHDHIHKSYEDIVLPLQQQRGRLSVNELPHLPPITLHQAHHIGNEHAHHIHAEMHRAEKFHKLNTSPNPLHPKGNSESPSSPHQHPPTSE